MKTLNKTHFSRSIALCGLLTTGLTGASHAQPDVLNAPKAQNPPNRPARPRLDALPPEQRATERLRRQFQMLGATDQRVLDALMTYVESEIKARRDLTEKGSELQRSLRGNAASDAQITGLLNNYLASVEDDKSRRDKAQTALQEIVDPTKFPKIEALLTLLGLLHDAPPAINTGMGARRLPGNAANGGGRNRQNGAPNPNAAPAA